MICTASSQWTLLTSSQPEWSCQLCTRTRVWWSCQLCSWRGSVW